MICKDIDLLIKYIRNDIKTTSGFVIVYLPRDNIYISIHIRKLEPINYICKIYLPHCYYLPYINISTSRFYSIHNDEEKKLDKMMEKLENTLIKISKIDFSDYFKFLYDLYRINSDIAVERDEILTLMININLLLRILNQRKKNRFTIDDYKELSQFLLYSTSAGYFSSSPLTFYKSALYLHVTLFGRSWMFDENEERCLQDLLKMVQLDPYKALDSLKRRFVNKALSN